jgi:4-hydroxybenzoate polyprenyltransferase
MNNSNLIKLLTYLGALPFFLAIYIGLSKQSFLEVVGIQWFLTYGLLILSFMAGTLWGQVVNQPIKVKRIALGSNAITLSAWFALLLADPAVVLIIMALGFVAIYLLEAVVMSPIKRPDYYRVLRLRVTTLVVVAHGLMFLQVLT